MGQASAKSTEHMGSVKESPQSKCSICDKEKVAYKCRGCSQDFCFDHLAEHRETLIKQFGQIENDHNQLHRRLIEQKKAPRKPPSIQEVDKWEKDSIKKIKEAAKESRQALIQHQNNYFSEIEKQLSQLAEQLEKIRQENEVHEIDLDQIKTKLTKLAEELGQLPNTKIQQDSASFITKISVILLPGNRQEEKVTNIDSNRSQTKLSEELNQFTNISNPDESASVINENSISASSGMCD
ncbi:unnamed protein product [Rotaria sp. Silwood2]|nr:unnamed protein product [Rotaria sp. Silwood2]CAF3550886.1 unnamed protein product [Rotaria sp. Silwood2]CAF4151838.1 unnamed protein product [Rotaria sp. Silwood2]CAF4658725.1 unnamed protein product [Rotaria sp. Silwood2]CAF4800568.1 unnamed protein product [Rotaria sp. Silwood2]